MNKTEPVKSNKALILCIARGKSYDAEMAKQPAPGRAIKRPEFIVRVELMEIHEFSERYPDIRSKASKSTKQNEEPKDGKEGRREGNVRSAERGKTSAAARHNKGTVRDPNKRFQLTLRERSTDRNLGAPSTATVQTISYCNRETREGRYWKGAQRRRRTSNGARNEGKEESSRGDHSTLKRVAGT